MKTWSLHYLNARGALDAFKDQIDMALRAVARRIEQVAEPLVLDIVLQSVSNGGIPEIGHSGNSPRPGVLVLTFDPDNPNLPKNMVEPLERMIAHELHHALRWETVGYGSTLGEALISEGLAGRFVQELYGNEGEMWERAIPQQELGKYAELAGAHSSDTDYDHSVWFFGRGEFPRWVGYTLGWEIVGDFLRNNPDAWPSGLASMPAEELLPSLEALAKG